MVVTGMDIVDGCIFKNYHLLTVHLFHALTLGRMSVSKGRTVATLLDAGFPPLRGEGGRPDKLISFKTMANAQANILQCATYEDLFERARAFQDSLHAIYKTYHPCTWQWRRPRRW